MKNPFKRKAARKEMGITGRSQQFQLGAISHQHMLAQANATALSSFHLAHYNDKPSSENDFHYGQAAYFHSKIYNLRGLQESTPTSSKFKYRKPESPTSSDFYSEN